MRINHNKLIAFAWRWGRACFSLKFNLDSFVLKIIHSLCIYFYSGTSQSGGGSGVGSNISSCESLTSLLTRDLLLQKARPNNSTLVHNLSDNNFQHTFGAASPIIPPTTLTLNSFIQSSCEQHIANRLRYQPYLETCFS